MSTTLNASSTSSLPEQLRQFDEDQDGWLNTKEIEKIERVLSPRDFEKFKDDLTLSIGQELRKSSSSSERLIPTHDLNFEPFMVLWSLQRLLKKNQKVIQEDISKDTELPRSRVSKILDSMDQALHPERGWIGRAENPAARHQKLISITEAGKAMFRRAHADYRKQYAKTMGVVSLQKLIQLKTILYQLNQALDPNWNPDATLE